MICVLLASRASATTLFEDTERFDPTAMNSNDHVISFLIDANREHAALYPRGEIAIEFVTERLDGPTNRSRVTGHGWWDGEASRMEIQEISELDRIFVLNSDESTKLYINNY